MIWSRSWIAGGCRQSSPVRPCAAGWPYHRAWFARLWRRLIGLGQPICPNKAGRGQKAAKMGAGFLKSRNQGTACRGSSRETNRPASNPSFCFPVPQTQAGCLLRLLGYGFGLGLRFFPHILNSLEPTSAVLVRRVDPIFGCCSTVGHRESQRSQIGIRNSSCAAHL